MKHLQSAEKNLEPLRVQNRWMYWKRQLYLKRAKKILFSGGYDLTILYFCEEGGKVLHVEVQKPIFHVSLTWKVSCSFSTTPGCLFIRWALL